MVRFLHDRLRRLLCSGSRMASLCALLLVLAAPQPAQAGGAENALIVVNAENADSVAIAQEYTRLRRIPACNVLELHGIPTGPTLPLKQFRDKILTPILLTIQQRGLSDQIDYIVYSAGFPYGVDVSPEMAGKTYPIFVTQPASLTGLTYLYQMALSGRPDYLSMDSNWYFRRLKTEHADTPWTEEDNRNETQLARLIAQLQTARKSQTPAAQEETRKLLTDADTILQALRKHHPNNASLLYDLSCVLALQGKPDEAMAMLQTAFGAGWRSATLTEGDADLASLRVREDFKRLLASMRAVPVEMRPAHAFHHAIAWGPIGDPTTEPTGRHYYLSAMLAYTGEKAGTLQEAIEEIRKSVSADGTRPKGTVYFMISTDQARTGPREWAFQPAANALKKLGVQAQVLSGVLPPNRPDVAGAMIGAATFDWKASGSRILPGAFCDHLTSFGGVMTGAGQTLLSEFLRNGAAGACGTVTEPYAMPAKFPNAFLHVYYAGGCSLAEAFYQSVQGPYQQLLVGDPLCRPWAKIPVVTVSGLQPNERVQKPRKLMPHTTGGAPVLRYELYVDGHRRQSCAPNSALNLNPTGLKPGLHEARIVAVAGPLEATGRTILPFLVSP